jgi:hypothetical protein
MSGATNARRRWRVIWDSLMHFAAVKLGDARSIALQKLALKLVSLDEQLDQAWVRRARASAACRDHLHPDPAALELGLDR